MGSYKSNLAKLRGALLAIGLVAATGASMAQSAVTLTATATTANMPDGQSVPMWGYFCGSVTGTGASCTAMNGSAQSGTSWQPPLIRVPAGAALTITLSNQLSFAGTAVPTSIVIDGQLGGGLGGTPARMAAIVHSPYGTTWPGTAGSADASSCTTGNPQDAADAGTFCPPAQVARVRSFATEVPAGGVSGSNSIPALTWNNLRPGTYLIHSGTEPSIQHGMGLYGVLVVTESTANSAYGTAFDQDVPLLFSEIDPDQNRAVAAAVATVGFSETAPWDGPGKCKSGAAACYPPAVNYSPRYYLINGNSFDRSSPTASTLSVAASLADTSALSGNVLLRIVNAGQRLHIPSVVGANMTLLAEDGNKVPGGTRVQSSLPMPPAKTFDVTIRPNLASSTAYAPGTYPVYDRQLSLSTNNQRDGGMQAYIAVAGGAASGTGSSASAVTAKANPDSYAVVPGSTLTVSDLGKGLMANDVGVYGVRLDGAAPATGTLTLNANGTFTYVSDASLSSGSVSFNYCANNALSGDGSLCTTVTVSAAAAAAAPVANDVAFTSRVATRFASPPPGLMASVTNAAGLTLKANAPTSVTGGTVFVNEDGSFVATPNSGSSSVSFGYSVTNAQNTASNTATATVNFLPGSGLQVAVKDGPTGQAITDYRWIIEEDRTFWVDPQCQINGANRPASCPPLPVESLGYNFHSASMPVIAQGCVGTVSCEAGQQVQTVPAVCDVGNGVCRTGGPTQKTPVSPADVNLDPNKRYFVSILPGDAINPTISGFGGTPKDCGTFDPNSDNWKLYNPGDGSSGNCGHEMGGVQVAPIGSNASPSVAVNLQQIPLPTAKISVFVYQDDNPLNGENDAGGGVDVIAPNEPGLGGFEIKLFDQAGQLGDNTGQITYDEFNEPVSNALAGTIDPITGLDACPITARKDGLVGMIPTCPKYESDGKTPSPLAGQATIANLYPGLYEIQSFPAADRIARGEEWVQTNTLDGGKPHEAFIKPNEPGYFQEFGPGGFHVSIGYANPAIINARKAAYCNSAANGQNADGTNPYPCTNTLNVQVTNNHMSRTPDQRTYSSETYDHYSFTQCYVSIGPADSEDFAFQKCTPDGKVSFDHMPPGTFKISVFDQWNDIMLDGLVGTVVVSGNGGGGSTTDKIFPVTQWRTNLFTRTYVDTDGTGVSTDDKPGLALVNTNIRYRDGSIGFFNNTDLNGYAGFNEVFPFMNWLVVETTATRFKPEWTHVVYDAGGPVDCSAQATANGLPCTTVAANLASTAVRVPLPTDLRVPGAKYCDNADCLPGDAFNGGSTGMLFPPQAFGNTIGWQGLLGQNTFMEFGLKPFKKATANTPAENGGIHGQVVYASTRPFDDPTLLLQLSWEPGIPHATINLYSKTVDAQGNEVLKLVDSTQSASWDDWAQGFRKNADGSALVTAGSGLDAGYVPNMNCPGQDAGSPFFATLKNSKMWLDTPDGSGNKKALAYQSRFKCYDGWSQLNQAQPAPYDGYYSFPSVAAIDPATGKPSKTNCTACTTNPDDGTPMLPAGKYVVEVIVPNGYELVKEEDKNILMGDVYVAPVNQQFAGFGNIFILPDQASVNAYNSQSPGNLNNTNNLGATPRHEGDTGSVEAFWPCTGALRQVPDFNSEFPGAGQAAPFAGAMRNLCDRKEVTLGDEASVLAKFFLFSSTHIAGHFTGTITNDFASEFDPFSPQFGEKFGPPNLPVGLRDFNGNEVARVYSDQWGIYNGLYFSTWSPNPPNPTGYAPQMSIACMNDPGPILVNGVSMTDPSYNPAYSNFCYEQPFMPGTTTYMDTPVIPTQAFADGYNLPDSEYPDATPAISSVTTSDFAGPWAATTGATITIKALGDKVVQNPDFAGPMATTAPYNQKTITRHYGFGSTAGTAVLQDASGQNYALGVSNWTDGQITATLPVDLPACPKQQQGAPAAQCGELVITAANGKRSIDAITLTVGGSQPWLVTPTAVTAPAGKTVQDYHDAFGRLDLTPQAINQSSIQVAIDSASPGDLIIVAPGTYHENLLMWKPVRLQGVGASSVTLNADAHPAGHMDQWRRQVNCIFGIDLNGVPNANDAAFDPTGSGYACPAGMHQRGDRIPFEAIIGWDASGNGNLAQVLQEPTLMGSYEGAGITVIGRGVRAPDCSDSTFGANCHDFWGQNATGGAGAFTDGSVYLYDGLHSNGNQVANPDDCVAHPNAVDGTDYGTSNFYCNPSRIDGISVLNSSQGGGGLFIHSWAHNLEVSNTHISANHGTLAGAINLGNGETPDAFVNDGTSCGTALTGANAVQPCPPVPGNTATNAAIPFQFNTNVRIHHNMLYNNASIGDALFSGTPAGAGAITVSAGADGYRIDHNWIAGNLSTGDGGGLQHLGLSFSGSIDHNYVLFNQSTNPTLPTNGGGIVIEGANLDRQLAGNECGSTNDQDCPPGLGEGTGAGLVIDANLIFGNSAESGSGGGVRLQQLNGSELIAFPVDPTQWYDVTLTNNIIANNVAGYDGGGVSLQDALRAKLINNTIASNDTTSSAGVLFKTLGAIMSNTPPPGCTPQTDPTLPQDPSCLVDFYVPEYQPSGLVTMTHTVNLRDQITSGALSLACPVDAPFGYANADCATFSRPALINNLFWKNRSFKVGIVDTAGSGSNSGLTSQQNLVAMVPLLNQTSTGQCNDAGVDASNNALATQYWDIGLRVDDVNGHLLTRNAHSLLVMHSILTGDANTTNETVASATNLLPGAAPVTGQTCNGARVTPEYCNAGGGTGLNGAAGCRGYNVPPGASETTSTASVFVFNGIQPTATVDEGHNWLNLSYGPLTLARVTATPGQSLTELLVASADAGNASGVAYGVVAGSPAIGHGTVATGVPAQDYFGQPRSPSGPTIGAIELAAPAPTADSISPSMALRGTSVNVTLSGTHFYAHSTTVSVSGNGVTVVVNSVNATSIDMTLQIAASADMGARNVTVTTPGGIATLYNGFTVLAPTLANISPVTGYQGYSVPVTITGSNLQNTNGISGLPGSVTLSGLSASPDGSTVTATLNVPSTVSAGMYNIGVTTSVNGPAIGAVPFTIATPPSPTITASPSSLPRNQSGATLHLNGQWLQTTSSVTVSPSGSGVTLGAFTVVSDSEVDVPVTTNGSAGGAYTLTLTALGGTAQTTITVLVPTLNSITPDTGNQGMIYPVTLSGVGLTGATSLTFSPGSITVSNFTVQNDTTVTATFTVSTSAALGVHTVRVNTPNGNTGTVNFTVTTPPPAALTSITPTDGNRGQTLTGVTLVGTNFTTNSNISGASNITVSNKVVVSSTLITADFAIASNATVGVRNIYVTAVGGNSNTVPFTVHGPTLTTLSATSGYKGHNYPVTLTGTLLTGATGLVFSGSGMSTSSFAVVNDTTVQATIMVAPNAGTGSHNVAVATPIGNTPNLTFTVSGPSMTSVSPTSASRGAPAFQMTLTGVDLTADGGLIPSAITFSSCTGCTATDIAAIDDSTITATVTIPNTASLGTKNITLVTPNGNAVLNGAFTVTGATVGWALPNMTQASANRLNPIDGTVVVRNTQAVGPTAANLVFTADPTIAPNASQPGAWSILGNDPLTTCNSSTVLAPGGVDSCTIRVHYDPQGSTANSTAKVTITGIGMATPTVSSSNITAN